MMMVLHLVLHFIHSPTYIHTYILRVLIVALALEHFHICKWTTNHFGGAFRKSVDVTIMTCAVFTRGRVH